MAITNKPVEVLQMQAQIAANQHWIKLKSIHPKLKEFKQPEIRMCNRLKVTAGKAHLVDGYIRLSVEMMQENYKEMCEDTIAHELIHFVAFYLYHDSGHGKAWKSIMRNYGLDDGAYHNMTTARMRAKRGS
jgi:predicted SprT family Zn-dependent metalloprotease